MLKLRKTLLNFLVLIICVINCYTQSIIPNKLFEEVKIRMDNLPHSPTTSLQVFEQAPSVDLARDVVNAVGAQLLKVNKQKLVQLTSSQEDLIELEIPYHDTKIRLSLFPFSPLPHRFLIKTPSGITQLTESIQFYRGVVQGDEQSVVAISIHDGEFMGLISCRQMGNMILARHTVDTSVHLLYKDNQIKTPLPFSCETVLKPGYVPEFPSGLSAARSGSTGCVKIFMEASYSIYQNFDNDLNRVINFITGLFNQVSTLYASEDVDLVLSDLYIWTEEDPYDHETSTEALESFMNAPLKGNGHLRHLLDMIDNNNGGRAYVDVLCDKVRNIGYSNIVPFYLGTPTFSWSVNVIAHELGHGMGSFHTQDCIWGPEKCTAIDGCADSNPEVGCGSCADAPVPDKGTIMSYCHLNGGIDFTLGFGKEPGDLIRNRIAEASCIIPCESAPATLCLLSVEEIEVKQATCGGPNGSIVVHVSGASGAETYDIGDGPQAGNQFDNLSSGEYQIVVKDGISCIRTASVTIEMSYEAPDLDLIITNASCKGEDGTVLIIPNGGTTPYRYIFDGQVAMDSFYSGIVPGEYKVDLIDSAGCIASQKFAIYEDSAPQIEANLRGTKCGLNNGEIELVALGGTTPYHFSISNVVFDTSLSTSSPASLYNLVSGTYEIIMQDDHGCGDSLTINIEPSNTLTLGFNEVAATCNQSNGSLEISVSGGSSPYRYFLDDYEQSAATFSQLAADRYIIKVIDDDQCEKRSTITIPYDSAFVAPKLPQRLDLCEGETINLEVGIPGNASISWSQDERLIGDSISSLTIAQPGNYQVTAIYSEHCQLTTAMQIVGRSRPQINLNTSDTICAGQYLELADYDSTYTYLWSQGTIGPKTSFAESGNYTLEVRDSFGCTQSFDLDIQVIQPVILTSEKENLMICPGDEVQLLVSGADAYSWSADDPSLIERGISNPLVAPSHPTVYQVVGRNTCFQDSLEIAITFFPFLENLPSDFQLLAGIPLEISLPQAADLQWKSELELGCDTCNQTTVKAQSAGDLFVSYTDENGCFRHDSAHLTVKSLSEILPPLVNVITPNGDNENDFLTFEPGDNFQSLQLQVFGQDGSKLFESKDYKNDWSGTFEGRPLPEGIYFYALTLRFEGQIIQLDSDLTIIRD